MKKIVFGITSLTLGGAERVLVDIANELQGKYDVTIFTLYAKGEFENELSKEIKIVNYIDKTRNELSKWEKLKISIKLFLSKKKIYNKYIGGKFDTEIAFLEGPITRLFSYKNSAVKKITWVHNDIAQVFGEGFKAKIKRKLDKKCYEKYNTIVFVSNDNKEKFEDVYKIPNNKLVINNYISVSRVLEKSKHNYEKIFEKNQVNFLTVARLTKQKAIDRLIKVHSKLINDGIYHNFYVIGDGPEKAYLDELIEKNNVIKTFKLVGKKDNPYPYMKDCDAFALLSNFEGLPMTILEARILNKPILITDTASREAVQNYNKSYITANNEDGIYEGIKYLIENISKFKNCSDEDYMENTRLIKKIEKLVG